MARTWPTVPLSDDSDASAPETLVASIRAGDETAFEALVRTYAQPLVAFAYRYVEDADAAIDLVQDMFAALWERRATWTVHGSIRAYLYATVRNRALNAIRHEAVAHRWREAGALDVTPAVSAAAPASDRAEQSEVRLAVGRALEALTPKARAVARLWFLEEMTQPEIAQALGMTLAAVGNHVVRAGKRLRLLLSDVWP